MCHKMNKAKLFIIATKHSYIESPIIDKEHISKVIDYDQCDCQHYGPDEMQLTIACLLPVRTRKLGGNITQWMCHCMTEFK